MQHSLSLYIYMYFTYVVIYIKYNTSDRKLRLVFQHTFLSHLISCRHISTQQKYYYYYKNTSFTVSAEFVAGD